MPKQITQYDLLISCPSDVEEELNIIKEVIETFNRSVGEANNASINPKHWSIDSYPESGSKPQELLNKQFVLQCDLAVAVFWTRFGTPTDDYGSGTEEEIESLIKEGKQVFLYFSDCQLNPSTIDSNQYKLVQDFRNKYKDRGIYATYSDVSEFKKSLSNHLYKYFLKLFTEDEYLTKPEKIVNSKLAIKGVENGKIVEHPLLTKKHLKNSQIVKKLRENINQIFEKTKNIQIAEKVINDDEDEERHQLIPNNNTFANLNKVALEWKNATSKFGSLIETFDVEIMDDDKNLIIDYANQNNISFDENKLFNFGNITKVKQPFVGGSFGGGSSYSLQGTDKEKEKYGLLMELANKIDEFNQWIKYFESIDSNSYVELALTNNGTNFDEDIDIKLLVKEGYICNGEHLPFPGNDILEEATKKFDYIYRSKKSVSIMEFEDYNQRSTSYTVDLPYGLYNPTYKQEVEANKVDFIRTAQTTFCYEYFKDDGYDVICYNLSYIKQNTNVYFPSLLVFGSTVDEIHYEIRSKHSPQIIKGTLKIN
ncbi:hypothetical protein [Virgibacillus sp. DJP39]|uniref:hypothetical protein n=1 Tax=Virgibacillus sp. DJP39 TaxID=3409790 RepID=UPI003BB580B6